MSKIVNVDFSQGLYDGFIKSCFLQLQFSFYIIITFLLEKKIRRIFWVCLLLANWENCRLVM